MTHKASDNLTDIQSRKGDHIRLCLDPRSQADQSVFAPYRLPYTALPEISLDQVDTSCSFFAKTLRMPLIIASMTGGSEHGRSINTNLAIAAEHCGVAMGVGSQRIGLEKQDAQDTFKLVRKHAPHACIIANMGVVQLNYGHTVDSYRKVVDMVEADALYIHLNPLQEALQPGGDTDFSDLLTKIAQLVRAVPVPVIAKEVGHGVSADVARRLCEVGVQGIDVAGVGGTSYAWVEAERSHDDDFAAWFKHFGIPTDQAIAEVSTTVPSGIPVIASGGVRSPVDGLIARALGADLFSAAIPFLAPAMESPEKSIEIVQHWQKGLAVAMFASGVTNWEAAASLSLTKQ